MTKNPILKFAIRKSLFLSILIFPNFVSGFTSDTTKTDSLISLEKFFELLHEDDDQPELPTVDSSNTINKSIPQRELEDYHKKAFDYIERFAHVAIAEQKKYGIPTSIKLAQGLLESGFGKSKMALTINNHFGIKCNSGQKRQPGKCYTFHDDTKYDKFLKFESAWASYRYHSLVLQDQRYKSLYALEITDYENWAIGLQKAGYASDKNYAKKLIRIIELYELYEYDEQQ